LVPVRLLLVLGEVFLLLALKLVLVLKLVLILLVRLVPLGMTFWASWQVTRVSLSLIIRNIWIKKVLCLIFELWLTYYRVIMQF
jgi:hypothetical protein